MKTIRKKTNYQKKERICVYGIFPHFIAIGTWTDNTFELQICIKRCCFWMLLFLCVGCAGYLSWVADIEDLVFHGLDNNNKPAVRDYEKLTKKKQTSGVRLVFASVIRRIIEGSLILGVSSSLHS